FRHQEIPTAGVLQRAAQGGGRLGGAAIDAHLRRRGGVGPPRRGRVPRQREAPPRIGLGEELLDAEEDLRRLEDGALGIVPQEGMALPGVLREAAQGALHVAVQEQRRTPGQVVEEAGRLLMEERQVVLDAGGRDPLADVAIDRAAAGVALEALAPAAAEEIARRLVERELASREQPHPVDRVETALRVGIEAADALDVRPEE